MTIEEQCVSLELAKQLKELGVEQESEFVWIDRLLKITETTENNIIILWKDVLSEWEPNSEIIASAFTTTELLEMLPAQIDNKYDLEIVKSYDNTEFAIYYVDRSTEITDYCFNKGEDDIDVDDKNFANALAKMLIYLKQNNLTN